MDQMSWVKDVEERKVCLYDCSLWLYCVISKSIERHATGI